MNMSRKKYVKYLMGYFGWSRDQAVARAKLINSYNIPYENSFCAMVRDSFFELFNEINPTKND